MKKLDLKGFNGQYAFLKQEEPKIIITIPGGN